MLDDVLDRLVDHLVEGLRVLAELIGRARERLGDARAEFRLENRQHPLSHTHPREAFVEIVGIVPGIQSGCRAERTGRLATHPEQRSEPAQTVLVLAHRRHALQARRPGAAGEPEQHRLGLVVERVPQEHRGCADPGSGFPQHPVPRLARRRLRAALAVDLDPHHDRFEAESPGDAGRTRGDLRRVGLQAVIDGDGRRRYPPFRRLEGRGCGERERVGASGEGDDHRRALSNVGERSAHGEADLCDDR